MVADGRDCAAAQPLADALLMPLLLMSWIAIEQFDRHAFRRLDEADAHARPHRRRLLGELDALGFEVGGDLVDAAHGKAEMIEAAIGDRRRGIDFFVRRRPAR